MVGQLYRSRNNRVIAGVAGGLGQYLDIDPVLIRIGWAALFFLGGSGLLLYILAWILIPEEPEVTQKSAQDDLTEAAAEEFAGEETEQNAGGAGQAEARPPVNRAAVVERRRRFVGGALVILGLVFLANQFLPAVIDSDWLWPLALIGLGLVILNRRGGR